VDKLTRRELLKRGAAVGGTLVWATPVVQSLGARPAWAVYRPGVSYVALNVVCGGKAYVIKFEFDCRCWDRAPGNFPDCEGDFVPVGEKADGGALGFGASVDPNGCVVITAPPGCVITASAVKASHECCPSHTGIGTKVYCGCPVP
jgi:hypothetical protein